MANPEITNIDLGSVVVERGPMRDELLTFGGAATYPAGTLLARDTTTNKLVVYVKGGVVQGNGVVHSLLNSDATATAAGDVPVRVMQSGTVRKDRLIITADGDASNVDHIEVDGLRTLGINVQDHQDLSVLDNQ